MAESPEDLAEFIREMSEAAGAVLSSYRAGAAFTIKRKPDNSLVTDADLASERVILERIRRRFPADKICSEEAGLSSSDRTPGSYIWIIDPLDGTTNFAHGYDFFCVSIARGRFTSEGPVVVEAGAIHDPIRKKTYVAGLGRGATVNGKALKTTQTANLRDAFLVTGFSYNAGIELKKDIMTLYEVAIRCKGIRGDGSAALDMALVAEGVYDASWDYGLKPWDVAAGGLIIAEAGGTVVNYPGEPTDSFDVERPGLICGAPVIVKALSELIRQV